jgi:cAMP-dependent protein kinase regulator
MISGKVRVNAGEDTLAVLEKGDYFGETALLKDVPRTANIDALSDGRLLVIEGDAFRELMNQLPQLAESLRNIPTIRSLLKQVTFLEKLPADKLALLASRFKLKAYKPGTALIEQGTRGRFFFVITEGEVDIVVKSLDGREKLIAQRGAGSVMGEISLIKGVPTTATVRARGAVKALVLDEATFKELCQEIPGLRFNLDQVGEERLKELSGKD